MKICPDHWTKLREAVKARGLWQYVAKDGHAAMQNIVLELEGREREAYFDPLMHAHNMIWSAALERCGLALMMGDKCPVCEGIAFNLALPDNTYTPDAEEHYWIDGPADAVLAICTEKGMPATPTGAQADDERRGTE